MYFVFLDCDLIIGNTKDALIERAIKEDDPDSKSKKYASYLPFWA